MHIFPFPISRRSGWRKSHRNRLRSCSRRRRRNHISEYMPSRSPPQHTSEWQPQPVEESPQFQYCSENQRLMPEWRLKNCDHTDDSAFPARRGKTIHSNLKSFMSFVRYDVHRGYDLDKAERPIHPVPLSQYRDCKQMGERLNAQVDFVIEGINSQLEMFGERYELDKLVKVVENRPARTTFVTFTVKEVSHNPNAVRTVRAMVHNAPRFNFKLREWSFKPEEEEDSAITE